jgi:hypothetical protein
MVLTTSSTVVLVGRSIVFEMNAGLQHLPRMVIYHLAPLTSLSVKPLQ